tara:strand:- start:1465 stop:2334 length:870 start_codon:yes stop_codon:yes gene_type:complete
MKILDAYNSMAKELFLEVEVDDDKIIKYKKEDGEQGEMKAGSAKTMPKDHPAKMAYDKMAGGDSDGEKPKGQGLSGSDFDRDGDGDVDKDDVALGKTDADDEPERDTSDDYDDETGEYKGTNEKVKKLHKVVNDVKGDGDKYDYSYERQQKLEKMTEKEAEGIQNDLKAEVERLEGKGKKLPRKGYGPINLDDVPEGKYHSGDPYDEFVWDSEKDRENFLSAALHSSNWYTMTHPSEPGSFGGRIDVKWKQEESIKINGKQYRPIKESKKEKTFAEIVKENSKRFAKRK